MATRNIIPYSDRSQNLGSATYPLSGIFVERLYLYADGGSTYLDTKPTGSSGEGVTSFRDVTYNLSSVPGGGLLSGQTSLSTTGALPIAVFATLECITSNDGNYSVGDKITYMLSDEDEGINIYWNTTGIYATVSPSVLIPDNSTGVMQKHDIMNHPSRWRLHLKMAYAE